VVTRRSASERCDGDGVSCPTGRGGHGRGDHRKSWQRPDRFGALYDRYATVLYGYACLRVGRGSADDVVADTFLAALDAAGVDEALQHDERVGIRVYAQRPAVLR
jgi:hypothetical protein